jgi:hypothetical protein
MAARSSPRGGGGSDFKCTLCDVRLFTDGTSGCSRKITQKDLTSARMVFDHPTLKSNEVVCDAHFDPNVLDRDRAWLENPRTSYLEIKGPGKAGPKVNTVRRSCAQWRSAARLGVSVDDLQMFDDLRKTYFLSLHLEKQLERSLAVAETLRLAEEAKQLAEDKLALAEKLLKEGSGFSILSYKDWESLRPEQQKEFVSLTGLRSFDRLEHWASHVSCSTAGRPRSISLIEMVGLSFIRINTGIPWSQLAAFYSENAAKLRSAFDFTLDQLADHASDLVFPEVTDGVVHKWAEATNRETTAAARAFLKVGEEVKLCIFNVDGTYHRIAASASFIVQRLTFSGQKKYNLVKSHQVATADGRYAFYTLGGGDVDDQDFLKTDLEDPDSQLFKMIAKAKALDYVPVVILDGGYFERSHDAVTAVGATPWIKDNNKAQRQERQDALNHDNQMVIRSAVERSNRNNAKKFLKNRAVRFHDIWRLENMMLIALAETSMLDWPLTRPTGGLTKNRFGEILNTDLQSLERRSNVRNAWVYVEKDQVPATLRSVLEPTVPAPASAPADAAPADAAPAAASSAIAPGVVIEAAGASKEDIDDAPAAGNPGSTSDMVPYQSIFSKTSLGDWISPGRVRRGYSYARLNWVRQIRVFCDNAVGQIVVTATVKHSRTQGAEYNVVMLIPKTGASLLRCRARCACYKGLSGQCGHIVGLALSMWRAASPENFEAAFRKNPRGTKHKTTEDLELFLGGKLVKNNAPKKNKATVVVAAKKGNYSFSAIAKRLEEDPIQKPKVVRVSDPSAKGKNAVAKKIRDADKERGTAKRAGAAKREKPASNEARPRVKRTTAKTAAAKGSRKRGALETVSAGGDEGDAGSPAPPLAKRSRSGGRHATAQEHS